MHLFSAWASDVCTTIAQSLCPFSIVTISSIDIAISVSALIIMHAINNNDDNNTSSSNKHNT